MLGRYTIAVASFCVTGVLTLISIFVVHPKPPGSFLVFATGAIVSLGMTLIEQRLAEHAREVQTAIKTELSDALDLCRLLDTLHDDDLRGEVYSLARSLGAGVVPPHIAAIRVPALYERAQSVYASNVSLTPERLLLWDNNPRFKRIVSTSARRRREDGAQFARTFVLSREAMTSGSKLIPPCLRVIQAQVDAQITVRIIWIEDLENDVVAPRRKIVSNFTIFDKVEAVDTTDAQVIYRTPSQRVQEFLDIQVEQLRYSHAVELYLGDTP